MIQAPSPVVTCRRPNLFSVALCRRRKKRHVPGAALLASKPLVCRGKLWSFSKFWFPCTTGPKRENCHSFFHSFIHSFVPSCIHPFMHPFIHSCIHSFIHSFIHSSINSFIYAFILSFIPVITCRRPLLSSVALCLAGPLDVFAFLTYAPLSP